jgi:hypothetical protein
MANPGLLGKASLAKDTDTTLYTVPASTVATVNVAFCNCNSFPVTVRLAVTSAGAPAASDYLEWEVPLGTGAASVLERGGIVIGAGENIFVRASAGNVAARAMGFIEAA